jgi:hypothetical protein
LGSTLEVPGVIKPAGLPLITTGIVTGRKLSRVKVTEKLPSGSGVLTEHGVLQPSPKEVRASAPEGVDSSWISNFGGFGLDVQPAIHRPATAIATGKARTRSLLATNEGVCAEIMSDD